MQLEQIYIMSDKNSVPCADKPADSTFIGNSNVIVNLINFVYDQNPHNVIMQGLEKGEEWVFSENIKIENEPFYIEHGYGNGYFVTVGQSYTYVTIITRKTEYAYFIFEIDLNPKNNDYNYRGKDNFLIPMNVLDDESESHKTNLKLTFLTDLDGIAYQIKDGYIYLDTNRQYSIGYSVTGPLTSQQAVKIIREGVEGADWTLHIQDGMTYYRIGNNLYKPSFGNNIIYAGTIYYDNGSIQTYQSMYYRLKFKLSPSDKEFINANF
ncbi:hypothetical protein AGMMS49982_20420 [Bacteroidia bacterium]|nr:hypothetical protein AGMMS49982_20420 [Bacteroidia bacterium]